jgi:membrane-associated protease RseP (regulator of RpoE activity)
MDQPFLFPNLATGPSNADPQDDTQHSTVVHRLPQYFSQPVPQPVSTAQGDIAFGRLLFHLFLLGLTVLTTTIAVGYLWLGGFWEGAVYSFTVLTIFMAHEMGHYIACRWYGVEATLPYFIPAPIPPVGTFGAFIKIKSPIPSRRALFDIGIAGPLAGFVFALPAAFIAHFYAMPAKPVEMTASTVIIHSPLLFRFFEQALHLPPLIELNPVMWAAWIGVFMTSLNLLPVGQLDGGHVTYAIFGRRGHRAIAWVGFISVIALAVYNIRDGMWNWVVYAALLTLIMRVGHPPVVDEDQPLGWARILVAIIGLLVFVLSFLPVPFTI